MASLEAVYAIQKFTSFLVINYSKLNVASSEFENCYGNFMNLEISKEIFNCINLLLNLYKDILAEIDIKKFEDWCFITSKRNYMEQLLLRCLKLSEGDVTFFEFLLVCVYIAKFSERIYEKYSCCKILKVTSDCLEAVYCRKYWYYFQENRGFRGLADFCRSLNSETPLENVGGECTAVIFPSVDAERNEKVKILQKLNDIKGVIDLVDIERKRISEIDKPYFKSSRQNTPVDFLINMIASAHALDQDLESFDYVQERTIKTGLRCGHCEAKCAQYPKYLVEELKKFEIIRQDV